MKSFIKNSGKKILILFALKYWNDILSSFWFKKVEYSFSSGVLRKWFYHGGQSWLNIYMPWVNELRHGSTQRPPWLNLYYISVLTSTFLKLMSRSVLNNQFKIYYQTSYADTYCWELLMHKLILPWIFLRRF